MHKSAAVGKNISLDATAEIVRANLIKFREEAKLSQAQAADSSGVPIDALRRYESGASASVPFEILVALAAIYGHTTDDFAKKDPPKANLENRPAFFLRTLPGVEIDQDDYDAIQEMINKANARRVAKGKKK